VFTRTHLSPITVDSDGDESFGAYLVFERLHEGCEGFTDGYLRFHHIEADAERWRIMKSRRRSDRDERVVMADVETYAVGWILINLFVYIRVLVIARTRAKPPGSSNRAQYDH